MISKLKNREFLWNSFAQIIQMIGAIVIVKLLAMYLSKGEYGKFALINSLIALFMILPFNAIIHGIFRYVAEHVSIKKYAEFFSINIFMVSVIFVNIYIVIWITLQFIDYNLKQYVNIISILVLSEIYKTMFRTIENARRYRKKIALSSLVEFFSKILLIILLTIFGMVSLQNILIILIIGNALCIAGLMFKNWKYLTFPTFSSFHQIFIPIVLFGIPLIFSQLFGWVRDMSNRWFLEVYVSSESVAVFALMATIAAIIPNGLNGFIGSYLVPIIYEKEHNEKGYAKNVLKKIIPQFILGSLAITIFMYFLKDFIVVLFTDEKYVEYSWMLPQMFIVYSLYIISMIASYEIYSQKKTILLLYPAIISAIVAFSSGFFLIKNYDLEGAFFSYLMTYSSYALVIFYIVFYRKASSD